MREKFLPKLIGVIRELLKQHQQVLFANGLAHHCGVGLIDEVVPLVENYLEATYLGGFSETYSVERSLIYFVPDVVSPLLNEYYF